ncbi:DUF968 domain-containing protein [Providencia rettgeri]|uniref:DUF968 domain-containing protein n=1 Tax=Providencia rettgeri TaxID=587 RepID=UPI001BACAC00|nr:DUF968 domain-containing protein [Providencia rettgeri]EIL1981262.1 DUF968 domain-containing protein [Providencia rettgeri]EIU9514033.1 DUF968 domain-containing protein [Providencia rettgeri]ELR5094086.1 DUF968 domain-containing protein [Providencia rettgeri]MBS0861340.1 DUF968 domain-containing protein [Providencia rettgeri]MBS0875163.1 DUF968 domain-containing protein [Providencia rettgeri]
MSHQWILTPIPVPELSAVIFRPGASELHKFNRRMLIIPVPESLGDKSVGPISLSSSFLSDEFNDVEDIKQILKLTVDPEPPASFMKNPKLLRWTNDKYLQWVKSQPCCGCGAISDDAHHIIDHGLSGMGTKPHDFFVIPLCRVDHSELHRDPKEWEKEHGTQIEFFIKLVNKAFALGVLG